MATVPAQRVPVDDRDPFERKLQWVYWACSAALAPWIVLLFVTQTPRAPAHQVQALSVGLILAIMASLLAAAWLYGVGSQLATLVAALAVTITFISGWFRTLTRAGGSRFAESIPVYSAVVVILVGLCAVTIRRSLRSLTSPTPAADRERPARWLSLALGLGALAMVPWLVIVLTVVPEVQVARHLRLAWTGLDVFELAAMILTGLGLHRRSPTVIVWGAVTGTLLICDAWINIVPATSAARLEGIVLAFVELPLAALSFWLAGRVTRLISTRLVSVGS